MKALTFLIRVVEPLLTGQAYSGEANSSQAFPFIPGSMIRGMLVSRYLRERSVEATEPTFRKLFLDDSICYLNAYPAHPRHKSRLLPKPLSWVVPKEEIQNPNPTVYDLAIESPEDSSSFKSPSASFCWQGEQSIQLGTPNMQFTLHHANHNRNRKSKNESQVYRYEAIATGEMFVGVIISDAKRDTLLSQLIFPLLKEETYRLGGSRSGGYGRVEITDVVLANEWHEYQPDSPNSQDMSRGSRDQVILTCLSDLIIRGVGGQVGTGLAELVGEAPLEAFQRWRLVGGFNRKWGLPLPQAWAIEAGSVFVFSSEFKINLEKLAKHGIGERRNEGFGRIAINWQTKPTLTQSELPKRGIESSEPSILSPESRAIAQRMANRQLQAKLDHWLISQINRLTSSPSHDFRSLPSATQLARVRLVARRAWYSKKLIIISQHFEQMSRLTKREWENARFKNEKLQEWILSQIGNRDTFDPIQDKPTVAGVMADLDSAWREQTIARLIEGVLKQALKEASRRAGGINE